MNNNFSGLLITIHFNSRYTIIQNKLFVLLCRDLHTHLKEGDKNISELSMIERILINIINRKQKTLIG